MLYPNEIYDFWGEKLCPHCMEHRPDFQEWDESYDVELIHYPGASCQECGHNSREIIRDPLRAA